jgi:glyoxylase-like metal-dependent hydrolase (beta-lactamase superfamily II)
LPRPKVICLTTGVFQENCYLLADPEAGDVVIIDPGEEAELILRRVATEGLTVRAVWLTHAHLDHILGVQTVVEQTGVPVSLHPADRPLYDGAADQGAWLGVRAPAPPPPDRDLAHGDTLGLGSLEFEVRHVPGHSPGSVAFVGHDVAFVGDAVFAGSVGRVDLPGGNGGTLLTSIREQLLTLPDETVVYAGHGPQTTIGAERRANPFLTGVIPLA